MPIFRRNVLSFYWLDLPFDTEDGGSTFLTNIGELIQDYTASHARRVVLFIIIVVKSSDF
jgi:hypothetical protein